MDAEEETRPEECLMRCEYHVIFNMSYSVPVLYFNISYAGMDEPHRDDLISIIVSIAHLIRSRNDPLLISPAVCRNKCEVGSSFSN